MHGTTCTWLTEKRNQENLSHHQLHKMTSKKWLENGFQRHKKCTLSPFILCVILCIITCISTIIYACFRLSRRPAATGMQSNIRSYQRQIMTVSLAFTICWLPRIGALDIVDMDIERTSNFGGPSTMLFHVYR